MPKRRYEPDPERDGLAQTLAWSFYRLGHIYDASLNRVIAARWPEWREQAQDLLGTYPGLRQAIVDKASAAPRPTPDREQEEGARPHP